MRRTLVLAALLCAACTSSRGGSVHPAASPSDSLGVRFLKGQNAVGAASDTFFAKIGPATTNVEALGYAVPLVNALKAFDDDLATFPASGKTHDDIQAVILANGALEKDLSTFSSASGTFATDSAKAKTAYAAVRADLGVSVS